MRLKQWLRGRTADVLAPSSQDRAQRVMAQSLRSFSGMCLKVADFIDSQRMTRAGADTQGAFLERLDRRPEPPAPPAPRKDGLERS